MSFLFLRLHSAKTESEAFLYKYDGKFHISGFLKSKSYYRLSYDDEDSLLTMVQLFFDEEFFNEDETKFFVSLYCVDNVWYDRFRICFASVDNKNMPSFMVGKEPVCKRYLFAVSSLTTFLKII